MFLSLASSRHRKSRSGQSLAEFAIVFPIFMLLVGGIIQFGIIFWGLNTLNQVVRDTGRWAATQQDCTSAGSVVTTANAIAAQSSLIGYTSGEFVVGTNASVVWPPTDGPDPGSAADPCPPTNNQELGWVRISLTHTVPVFFPFVPGNGTISSSTEFRMEPKPK